MIVVMHRAFKNAGDFLIFNRGLKLIKYHLKLKDDDIIIGKAWENLDRSISSEVSRHDINTIIVPGGPGVTRNITRTYPFIKDALRYNIPVVFLGVGSYIFPGRVRDISRYKLDTESLSVLKRLSEFYPIGVRDYYTYMLLRYNNINRISMNGCPAWYDLDMIGKLLDVPSEIKRIVFTPPSNPIFLSQALGLLKFLKHQFPYAKILVSFHRGIEGFQTEIARVARNFGMEIYDASGSDSKLERYRNYDVHIGYRVHAHIYFLSIHKPSYLIIEDSRGVGAVHSLGSYYILAQSPLLTNYIPIGISNFIRLVMGKITRFSIPLQNLFALNSKEIFEFLRYYIEIDFDRDFVSLAHSVNIIEKTYNKGMKPFIKQIKFDLGI